jgi:hypothetical protein
MDNSIDGGLAMETAGNFPEKLDKNVLAIPMGITAYNDFQRIAVQLQQKPEDLALDLLTNYMGRVNRSEKSQPHVK